MKRTWLVVAAALAAFAAQATTQPPAAASFKFERPIVIDGAGPRRLAIDVPLLVGASPFRVARRSIDPSSGQVVVHVTDGLRDLRIYDSGGREVAYLLVGNPPTEPAYAAAALLSIPVVDREHEKSSGFEADLGEPSLIDGLRIDGLRAPFLKRVRLEGSGDRAHWTTLVPEGTLFDLPEERLRQTELRFTAGVYRYLRVTWDDSNTGRLPMPPSARARQVVGAVAPPPLTTAVMFERRASEPGRSRYRVRLPGGRLPIVGIELDVAEEHVLRSASISEARLSNGELAPVVLGRTTLRRVVRDNVSADALRVPTELPSEAELELLVDDGDNAPLTVRGMKAVFAELPWIYLEAPAGTLTARYGSTTLAAPRYDLEAVRPNVRIDAVADARWGEPRAAPAETAAGATPPLPTGGASLDASQFKYVRGIGAGAAGLTAVRVDAALLAHAARPGSFADVRVVDGSDRQVPYLVERMDEPLSLDLPLERLAAAPKALPPGRASRSIYRVRYPFESLPPSRLVLTTSARVFDRTVTLGVEREPTRQRRDPWVEPVAAARWVHADQDRPTAPLTVTVPTLHATDLLLIVEEGDNTPLPIAAPRVLLPAYRLRLYRDAGAPLRVAYGRDDLARPQYDLALLSAQVLGAAATEVSLEVERSGPAETSAAAVISPRVFWIALSAAVVVLLGLIARLLRARS